MTQTPIPIVFCADERYAQHLGVTLASLLENNPRHQLAFTLVSISMSDEARRRIAEIIARFPNATITFKTFNAEPYAHFRLDYHISFASYLRLFMTDFVDPQLEKVLYLDSDLLILGDIGELWETAVDDYFVAAVRDPFSNLHTSLGFSPDETYFNAGVLVINLRKWREAEIIKTFVQFIEGNAAVLRYHDQDTLNAVFRGRCLFLDPKWNFQARAASSNAKKLGVPAATFNALRRAPSIIHFTTDKKPWFYLHRVNYKDLYFHYLRLTPWRDYVPPDRTLKNAFVKHLGIDVLIDDLRRRFPRALVFYRGLKRRLLPSR